MRERWKDVVGFEGLYKVSNCGRVWSETSERLKIPTKTEGRMTVLLWKHNKMKLCKVHRLVLFAFVGPPNKGNESCHNDGNPSNNHLSNLRWDTPQNNQRDRVRHGTSNRGERCGTSKLTLKEVRAILTALEKGVKQQELADKYQVRQSQISRIKSGIRWAHLRSV